MKTLEEAPSSLSDHRRIRRGMTLHAVRRWAGERRIGGARPATAYGGGVFLAVAALAQGLDAGAQAIEPVYEGHHYYPFPALRLGPSPRQVAECSNLCREAIDLTLVAARPCLFDSTAYADYRTCFRAWAGIPLPRNVDVVIPLHPWQF